MLEKIKLKIFKYFIKKIDIITFKNNYINYNK
jgi:hypothetical protein